MTLTAALAFAHLSHAQTLSSGVIIFANASAHQKFAQPTCTSEQTSTMQMNAVASASHTSVKKATTGMRSSAIASVHHPLVTTALKTTSGTAKTADADVHLKTALVWLFIKPTILTSANANVLKTQILLASLVLISTTFLAIAFVHQTNHAMMASTGTPEFATVWRNIVHAQLATIGTMTPTLAHASHNPVHLASNGTL